MYIRFIYLTRSEMRDYNVKNAFYIKQIRFQNMCSLHVSPTHPFHTNNVGPTFFSLTLSRTDRGGPIVMFQVVSPPNWAELFLWVGPSFCFARTTYITAQGICRLCDDATVIIARILTIQALQQTIVRRLSAVIHCIKYSKLF